MSNSPVDICDFKSLTQSKVVMIVVIPFLLACLVLHRIGLIIYNLYFHPLTSIPGPKSWIAFPVLRHLSGMRGNLDRDIFLYHEKYGEVVRFSDNEVSFTTADAWKMAYGHGHSLPKFNPREPGLPPDIIMSNNEDHTRFRKALSHAFSEKGLRGQEPIIKGYVDQLMEGLEHEMQSGKSVDMTMWFNLTTFDIISDLSFGKSFECLSKKSYTEFVKAIFNFIDVSPAVRAKRRFPILWNMTIGLVAPGWPGKHRDKLRELSKTTALQRAYDEEMCGRGDFMDAMLRHRGEKGGLSDAEIGMNANILFIAGSETTATLLSGVTYWLLRTPHAFEKVVKEVRSAFDNEQDINFLTATQRLPYMLACLEEALRIYPPVPGIFARVTQTDTEISGHVIPAKTQVGVHQMSSYWTARNFTRPREYIPERWLPESIKDSQSEFYNDNRDVLQPFSFGPRNCIGRNLAYNEMRLILARILWRFDLEMCPESSNWQDQKTKVLWTKHPLFCNLKLRSDLQKARE